VEWLLDLTLLPNFHLYFVYLYFVYLYFFVFV
jgi:hypothetical protein